MKADIAQMMTCDWAYFMPGWRESRGARLEHVLADALKMVLHYLPIQEAVLINGGGL
jgi:hypothetical protein